MLFVFMVVVIGITRNMMPPLITTIAHRPHQSDRFSPIFEMKIDEPPILDCSKRLPSTYPIHLESYP